MKHVSLSLVLLLGIPLASFAEGTKEVAPNATIDIFGNTTTDIAALHIANETFNNFAAYDNADPDGRLYVHVADPENECIFLGFSLGHRNVTSQNPPAVGFEFRVRDPDGNVVFGPMVVDPEDANIQTWLQGFTGPEQINGSDGYDAWVITSDDLMSGGWTDQGDYFIEFVTTSGSPDFLIDFWDITVANCSSTFPEQRTGRVWAYNWSIFAINDFGFPDRPFNGAFYVCAPDPVIPDAAFITKIDFNGSGFRPAAFNIVFNSFGTMNTGNVMADRRSVENENATQAEYQVFLNDPVDICETGQTGELTLAGISRCGPEDFCIRIVASKEGQIDLLLDFDGQDDIYTPGSADVMVAVNITSDQVGQPLCLDWDGRDGLGNLLAETTGSVIPVLVSYAQGIYHFPIFDAELMTEGFRVEAVRPPAPSPLLYYDDSNITVPSGSGEPAIQLTGCTLPCHRWLNFTDNSVPGFGNLHTINSWWFSQRVVREELFPLPAYLLCIIEGPAAVCEGSSAELTLSPQPVPSDGEVPAIASLQWTGPGILGSTEEATVTVESPGMYFVDVQWLTEQGDTCETSCAYFLETEPNKEASIDTLLLAGDTVDINGMPYTEGGQFVQILTASNGCDSVLTINITVLQTIVTYHLDDCAADIFEQTNTDYTEFTPEYPQPLSCADIGATIQYRVNPEVNRHSCTPGVGGTPAICVSSIEDCDYQPGSEKAFIFEVTVTPAPDTAVTLTELSFYEKAPEMFDWIDGADGLNNYPTLYGFRVLKDGTEIYREDSIPTTRDWTEEVFDLHEIDGFTTDTEAVYRFEMLGYCVVGNEATVTAWDLDEFALQASCVSPSLLEGSVTGTVQTATGEVLAGVEFSLVSHGTLLAEELSASDGSYVLDGIRLGTPFQIVASRDGDDDAGVSTLDLLHIQQHLLDIRPFEEPWQFIAADVNRSHSVSVTDILEIRKLLLGLYDEFPNSNSWRLGPSQQPALGTGDPWSFREVEYIEALTGDIVDMDFTSVKTGDVTGDARSRFKEKEISMRNSEPLHLFMRAKKFASGNQVHIVASESTWLYGLQWTLGADGGRISEVRSGMLDVDKSCAISSDGKLSMAWTDPHGKWVEEGTVLFSLRVTGTHLLPRILQEGLEALAQIDASLHELAISLLDSQHVPSIGQDGLTMIVNPNPFSEQTEFAIHSPFGGKSVLKVFDSSGRLLWSRRLYVREGRTEIILSKEEINGYRGLMIFHLRTTSNVATARVIRL